MTPSPIEEWEVQRMNKMSRAELMDYAMKADHWLGSTAEHIHKGDRCSARFLLRAALMGAIIQEVLRRLGELPEVPPVQDETQSFFPGEP
jgi:hypothetical protein